MKLHKHKYKIVGTRSYQCYSIFEGYTKETYDVYECEICKKQKEKLSDIQMPKFEWKEK